MAQSLTHVRGGGRQNPSVTIDDELRQALAELEMCSHVSAVNLEPSSRDASGDIGGNRPPGGVDGREDRHKPAREERAKDERVLRSAQHFRRRLAHGANRDHVLKEVRDALEAWRFAPKPKDKEHPMPGDFNWKRWVAESDLPDIDIARKCYVSRQYVRRIRDAYREVA